MFYCNKKWKTENTFLKQIVPKFLPEKDVVTSSVSYNYHL